MNRKPYPKYKESGVEWLGQVPEEWAVTKGRYIGSLLGSVTVSENDFEDDGTETRSGILYAKVDDLNRIDGSLILKNTNTQVAGYRAFSAPFLLFPKRGAAIFTNKVAIALHPMLFDPNLMGWRVNSTFNVKFVAYCLIARRLDDLADVSTVPQINNKHINPSGFPYPSLPEQIAIADFLDRETGLIDTLVAKKRRLIALLGEKRTALISRTVTRGLPADAAREFGLEPHSRFKDSGIEWLGEVPDGWAVKKLGHLSVIVRGGSPRPAGDPRYFDGDHIPWITVGEVTKDTNVFLETTETMLTKEGASCSRTIKSGTLIITNSGATLGVPKILKITGCANDGIVAFEEVSNKTDIYFLYYFLSSLTNDLRNRLKQGGGQPNLNTDLIKAIAAPFPNKSEQTAIATYLDRETAKIDQLVAKVEAAIARLQEYRTALITAAVTGKIDVREVV